MGTFVKTWKQLTPLERYCSCGLLIAMLVPFPSTHLGKVSKTPAVIETAPQSVQGGESILIKEEYPRLELNGKKLSQIKSTYYQFGVLSVYSPKYSELGFIPNQYENWRNGVRSFFTAPIVPWYVQSIYVHKKELQKESKNLRLPSSVLKKLNSASEEKRKRERQKTRSVLRQINGPIEDICFRLPVHSKKVSSYGSPRRLPSGREYFHTGLDLRAWQGTPIASAAEGIVALQEHMTAPGNNLILDHGGGLFTRYMHFSKFGKQSLGDRVPAGEIVGYSGSTGRSQAAHLHFEIIWKGNHASPLHFLRTWEQICDPK